MASQEKPHIIISNLEHYSVTKCVERLRGDGLADVSVVPADTGSGAVRVEDVLSHIRPSTILISLMLAQNETGVLQPVGELVKAVRDFEKSTGRKSRIFIHTDTAQALGKLKVDVLTMPVDYLTIVGHKFYGPRVGALYCRGLGGKLRGEPSNQTAPLSPLVCGGRQERGLRPGTQNTGMIAGLGKACELVADNVEEYSSHMRTLRDYLELKLKETFGDGVCINGCHGNLSERLPNTSNFSLTHPALSGHRILGALECSQISGGAACHSYTNARPSPFLLASGVEREVAVNALRVSVGRETTTADIDHFIADLRQASDRIIADHVTNSHN